MPHIPSRRGQLALGGSLLLILGTAPGTTTALPGLTAPFPGRPPAACAPAGDELLTESIPTSPDFARADGTVSALTLFIDFPGAEASISTRERFAEFFPATTEYFAASSYGRLDYRPAPLHRWLRMSQPFEAYGIERGASWHPDDEQGYNRLLRDIAAAVGDEVDFAGHDLVNVLAVPDAGPPATEKVLSVSFPGRDLAPAAGGHLRNVSFIWSRQPGDSPHRVLAHENGHSFGLPDLYWTGSGQAPLLAGHWDLMEQVWGPSNDFMAWHKWKLGWLDPGQVECVQGSGTTEHLIAPLGEPGGTKLVVVRTGPHEVLTLEVRTAGGLDGLVCRPGVLIARVRADLPSGEGPVRVSDATPGSDGCQDVPDPQVTAELTDAPYLPGETFRDARAGVRAEVLDADGHGRHRVRVTRR